MNDKQILNKCPNCNGLAAVAARAHCPKEGQCTWNVCNCGHTYDRFTGTHFVTTQNR